MSDLTGDYQAAVHAAASAAGWPQDRLTKLRQQQILRSLAAKSTFTKAALDVAHNVAALRAFLREGQRAYVTPGRMGEVERDAFEGEVGAAVRSCAANVDKLQAMLAAGGGGGSPGRPPSADVMAHRQGEVLILSERLRVATALFDRLRSLRYQQMQQAEAARARRRPNAAPAAAAGPGQQQLTSAQLHQRLQSGGGGYDPAAHGQQQQQQQPWQPGGPPGGGGSGGGQQQQVQVDAENQALQQELMGAHDQVQQAERSVREIATLNQMFSTAIMAQSEQIEKLYGQAVEATGHISRANVQLDKAIRANSSSRKFLLIFFIVASLGVLFLDWWYS